MLGAEAIWWLNSALLALLTHVGLLWLLIVAEPKEINKPVETTIIIESLPEPIDVTKPPEHSKTKPVNDRIEPATVQDAEAANAVKSNGTDQAKAVQNREKTTPPVEIVEQLDVAEPAKRAREIETHEPTKQPTPDGEIAPTTGTERAQTARSEQEPALVSTTDAAEKPTKAQAEATDQIQEADRSSGVVNDARTKPLKSDRDRETVKVSAATNEPERVAILAPRFEAVSRTKTKGKSQVPQASTLPIVKESEEAKPQKTASSEQEPALVSTSDAAEKPTRAQAEATDQIQEADRSSGVVKDARPKPLKSDRDRETAKVSTDTNEPERVAILAPRFEAVPRTETKGKSQVPQASTLPTVKENEEAKPQKTFVFPKNAQRLGSTPAKPSQPVKSPRVSAIETATSPNASTDQKKQEPSAERVEQVTIATPRRAGRVEPDGRYRDLLKFLKDSEITGCASVLPTIASDGSVFLSGFAADEALWDTFQKSMAEELRLRLPLNAATVAKPQCRALTFARTLSGYPRFSLSMKLENTDLVSGQFLNGAITDVRDRKVHLLVVDDEGLVQQADSLLQPRVSSLTFSIQMYVSGQAVRTAQMMIALAVDKPLTTVTTANQTMAEGFFAAVSEELAETEQTADIAIVSFYLRSAEEE